MIIDVILLLHKTTFTLYFVCICLNSRKNFKYGNIMEYSIKVRKINFKEFDAKAIDKKVNMIRK